MASSKITHYPFKYEEFEDNYEFSLYCEDFDYDMKSGTYHDYFRPKRINHDEILLNKGVDVSNAIPVLMYQRFIELLPSLSLRILSYTNKFNYIKCMLTRGLEAEHIEYFGATSEEHKIGMTYSGRVCGKLQAFPPKFLPYLRNIGLFSSLLVNPEILGSYMMNVKRLYIQAYCNSISSVIHLYMNPYIKTVYIQGSIGSYKEDGNVNGYFDDIVVLLKQLMHVDELVLQFLVEVPYYIKRKVCIKRTVNIIQKWLEERKRTTGYPKKFIFVFEDWDLQFYFYKKQLMVLQLPKKIPFENKKRFLYLTSDLVNRKPIPDDISLPNYFKKIENIYDNDI